MQLTLSPEDRPQESNPSDLSNDAQEHWEDVVDAEETLQRSVVSATGSQSSSTVSLRKKRRVLTKTTFVASPTPSRSHSAKARKKDPIVRKEEIEAALTHGTRYSVSYAFGILGGALETMKKPLTWLLALYLLSLLIAKVIYMPTIQMVLSPLCFIPGLSRSWLCQPLKPLPPVSFEKLVDIQGSTFEQLVGEPAGGSELSINVLRAEMATQDLSLLVRYSDLKSRDDISDMLRMIAVDAKKTVRGLSKLDAKVVGAIDEVMALNNYAISTIESAHEKATSWVLQAVSPVKIGQTAGEIIAEAFTLAMDESEQSIAKLILEAEVSWQNLEQMDADIGTLHEMITREDKHTTVERDKLLGELWTKLGGNKKAVRDYGDRLGLLNDLGRYRKQAAAHVKAQLRALHTMGDDLEVLRERVAAPGLLESKLPLQVHTESIRNGLERLREGRMKSRGRGIELEEQMLVG